MTKISLLTRLFLLLLILGSCKGESKKKSTDQLTIENTTRECIPQTLSMSGISFKISLTEPSPLQQIDITPKGLKNNRHTETLTTDGRVIKTEIADLNGDGFPELLFFTRSIGSGSYGHVIGYSVNAGKSMSQFYFPETTKNEAINKGYMGHDKFWIDGHHLIQEFPIYNPKDTNSQATGGYREVKYTLQNGEACRIFVIDKISDLSSN